MVTVSHSHFSLHAFAAGSCFCILAHIALPFKYGRHKSWGKQRVKIYGLINLMKETRKKKTQNKQALLALLHVGFVC